MAFYEDREYLLICIEWNALACFGIHNKGLGFGYGYKMHIWGVFVALHGMAA